MRYKDRNGTIMEGNCGQDKLLAALYQHAAGRLLLKPLVCPAVSRLVGGFMDTWPSALLIPSFVRKNKIDLSQYETKSFNSYNEFFTRRIKPEKRPVNREPDVLISPCDGKLSIYPLRTNSRFVIKHTQYSLASLCRSRKLASRYEGGYACVFRLTVDDYHRYCFMDDGVQSVNRRIKGVLHTVNPVANDEYPIYKENAREYSLLKSRNFGTLLVMEVGALFVGRICNYRGKEQVSRGQEKGRFEFGGSTVVVFVQKDKVQPDADLLANTRDGFETIVKMGEQIGRRAVK